MKTIKERAKAIIFERESDIATAFSRAFALVQEIANAPEPEQPNQSEQHLEMVNTPAPSVPDGWQPIETAPKDNKRSLFLARFNDDGTMQAFDYDGTWQSERESWELPQVYYYWATALGKVEEPTHWMYEPEWFSKLNSAQQPAFDHDAMDVFAANRFHVKPCDKRLFGWQVTAGDGEQTLYVGRKPDCENVARKLAGAFLDGAFYYSGLANAPNPPVLSDERILEIAMSDDVSLIEDQGPGVRPRITVHNSIGGVYAFARTIERELLGENE